MHTSSAYVQAAFDAGGTGYLLKSSAREEILAAVVKVLEGETYITPNLLLLRIRPSGICDSVRSCTKNSAATWTDLIEAGTGILTLYDEALTIPLGRISQFSRMVKERGQA